MGKAVACKKNTIAAETLKDPVLNGYAGDLIGKEMVKELKNMASTRANSVQQNQDVTQMNHLGGMFY